MNTVELGRTGEQISRLALGCMIMGTVTPEDEAVTILDRYAEAGGTFLDTADCYCWWERRGSHGGHSEELLGRWLARTGRRDEVFLATKGSGVIRDLDAVWIDGRPDWTAAYRNFAGAGAATLRDAIDGSLRRLGTDHVDLYYVHVDDRATPLEETLEALAGIVRSGKARYIGWSNVRTWRLERIRRLCAQNGWPAPVALQQQHSYLRRRAGVRHTSIVDDEQLDYLEEHDDLTLVAYSPILKGIYDSPDKRRNHGIMDPYHGPDADARLAAVTEVAAEAGAAPNAVVLAWLMHQTSPRVVPLIGPRTLQQYEAAQAALDIKLTDEQLTRLDTAGA
ncbi:aldo/keto reductase [Nonomuraea rhizosphaerae]|uniref:aldo/keto reductase n=1 Tax=Nonomuraea rhizosphaerae TaxID=2665663 RepID=UPI001C5F4ED5|nr:aldo/keto reductase [Nonomuraea rhizosphaerae]